MSEFKEKENERSCQKKLAPPRSIRDAGGKTQIVWDMIAKRYPKAAPLLTEMETVIDRAETLLHQLRRVPYDNDIVTKIRVSPTPSKRSNSTENSYSDVSEKQRSTGSIEELSLTCDEITEEVEEVGTRISYDRIPEMEDPSSSTSSASVEQVDEKVMIHSRAHSCENDELKSAEIFQPETKSLKYELNKQTNMSSHDEKRESATTKEVESLEGWERVVGVELTKLKKAHTKREVSIGSYENPKIRQTTKAKVPGTEEPTKIREETAGTVTTIDNAMSEPECLKVKKNRKTENVESPKRRAKTLPDSSPNRSPTINSSSFSVPVGTEKTKIRDEHKRKNVDEKHSPKNVSVRKTPEEILEDYATKNKKEPKFRILQEKQNSCIMECSFAGCTAQHRGTSESLVRNELAMTILRMLAEKQIDEKDMENLAPFSDLQMKEIIAFPTEGPELPENAMRKLYKCCLEKNSPKPIYTVKRSNEVGGVQHYAECRALGKVGHGWAIREEIAKVDAAEKVYMQL